MKNRDITRASKLSASKTSLQRKVIGNLREGQGYADKRKRKFINNYQKLKKKHRLEAEKSQSNVSSSKADNIAIFSQETVKMVNKAKPALSTDTPKSVSDTETPEVTNDEKRTERTGGNVPKDAKRFKKRGGKKNAKNRFTKAQEVFSEKRKAEQMQIETLKQQQEERTEALDKYKKTKFERHKKLSKKTRRGQPVMKFQMEVLLDKIRSQSQ